MTQKQFDKMRMKSYMKVCAICLAISGAIYAIVIHQTFGWDVVIDAIKEKMKGEE